MKTFLLIDDHAVVRKGVKFLLNDLYAPCEIEEAETEKQVLEMISIKSYDLLVLDINIPNTNTLDLLKKILHQSPNAKVLIFSMNPEKMYAQKYLEAGAKGFLSKDAPIDEMERAINLIFNDKNYYSQTLIDAIMSDKRGTTKSNPFKNLSEREFEICTLLLAGKSLTEISHDLNIQTSTTGTHKAKIFEKLNVKNIVELIELSKLHL